MTNIWDSELGEDATTNIWDEELGPEASPEAPPSRSTKEFFTDSLKTYQDSQQAMIEAQRPAGEIALGLAGGAASFIPYLGMSAFPVVQNELLMSQLASDDRLRKLMEKETNEKQKARYAKRLLSSEDRTSLEAKLKTPREASEAGHSLGEKAFSWMPQPETPMGTGVLEKVGGVMEQIVKPSKWAGKQIEKVFGVSVGHLSQLALEYYTFHALGKVGKKGVKKAKEGVVKGIEAVKAKRALKKIEAEGAESVVGDFLDDLEIVAEDLNTPEKVAKAKQKIVKEGQDAWKKMQEVRQTEEFKKSKKPIDISKRKAENRIPEEAQKLLDLAKEAKTRGKITPEETQRVLEFTAKVKEGLESKKSRKNQKLIDKILKKEEEFKVEIEAPKEEVPKIDAPKVEIEGDLPKDKTPLEKQWDEIPDRLKIDIEDGLEVARDMGIYETIREEVAKGKKVGEIKKAIKQGEYYAEDLGDFGYSPGDITEAIRSIKIKEFGDVKVLKDRIKKYEDATKQAEELKVTKPERLKEVGDEVVSEPSKIEDPGEFRDSLMKALLEEAAEKDKKGGKKKEPLEDVKEEPLVEKPEKLEKPKEETWEDVLAEEEPKRPKEEVDMEEYVKESEAYSEERPQKDVVDYFLGDEKGLFAMDFADIPKAVEKYIKKIKGGKPSNYKDYARNKEIFKDTGFWMGENKVWRYELNDNKGKVNFDKLKTRAKDFHMLEEILDYEDLYKAVPGAKDINIFYDPRISGAYFDPTTNLIGIGKKSKRYLFHELQHAVNNKLGGPRGTSLNKEKLGVIQSQLEYMQKISQNPKVKEAIKGVLDEGLKMSDLKWYENKMLPALERADPKIYGDLHLEWEAKRNYFRQIGEMEARLTEQRLKMSSKKKASESPWETLDQMLDKEALPLDEGTKLIPSKVDLSKTFFQRIFGNQKGEISITPEHIKKIKEQIKKGLFTSEDLIKGLRARGVSEGEIQKIFPTSLDQKMIEGTKGTVKTSQYGKGPAEEVINKGQKNSKKMEVPQVTRGEVAIVEGVREISAPVFKEAHSFKNPPRTFKDIGTAFKELTYRKILKGQNLVVSEKKSLMKKVKTLRRSIPYYNHKRIGTYAIAKQKDGVQILKNQGVSKIPKLTPKELKVYESFRSLYEDFYKRTNEARIASGEQPFPKTKDYFTFVQDLSYAENMGVGLFEDWRVIEKVIQENKPGSLPSYVYAKFRAGPEKPRKLDLNPFNVFDKYSSKTIEYIHMAPRIAKINELLSERVWPVDSAGRKKAPHTYTFMRLWNDHLAGKIPVEDFTNPVTRSLVHKVNSNVTSAILAGLWRTGIIQPTALVLTHNKIGTYYSTKGVMQTMRPSKWKEAYNKSNHLEGRSFDASLYEALTMDTKLLGKVQKGLTRVGTLHIKLMDQVTAVAGWLGAYEQGLRKFKKLSPELREKRAINYADDVVIETQASAAKSDIAPIQRLSWGKTITGLQTYSINQFGYLVRDVLGLGRRDPLPAKTKVIRAIRLITSVWALNSLLEDGVGISSPFPTPIRAYRKAIEEGYTEAESFAIFMKEFIEVVPVVGGATKYESSYGGPVADEMRKLLTKGDFKALLKLMGVRGTQQAVKSLRAYERGGTATDVALGRWVE